MYGEQRITHKDVLSHALYPEVFKQWMVFEEVYGPMDPIPTHVFLRPMEVNDEVSFAVEKGRRVYLKLAAIGDMDNSGSRQITFEANGERWFIRTTDETPALVAGPAGSARREKADPFDKGHISSPMPGVIVDVRTKESDKVKEGDVLFVLSAMKMETAIQAPKDGVVTRLLVNEGDNVDGDDLLGALDIE